MANTILRNPTKIYSHHVDNLREIQIALSHTQRLARAAISSSNQHGSLRSLLRLYSFLIGAWAECRLKKLLHEEYGFSEIERSAILKKSTQLEQWQLTVDTAFRKHHKINKAKLDAARLGVTHSARRDAIHDTLENELRIIIEIRNKLAHGQWVYPFNNEGTKVEQDKYLLINKENLQTLQFKFDLLNHLVEATHDLVVSPKTFERDFDIHFDKLLQVRENLVNKDYRKYEKSLIDKRQRARIALKQPIVSI